MNEIKSASFEGKTNVKIPAGATITKKEISIRVEEIENGFIIKKNYDIKYNLNGESHYEYFTKKWFAKENPITIDETVIEPKSLADEFE